MAVDGARGPTADDIVENGRGIVEDYALEWHARSGHLESQWCGPWDSEQNNVIHDSSDCLVVNYFNLCDSV